MTETGMKSIVRLVLLPLRQGDSSNKDVCWLIAHHSLLIFFLPTSPNSQSPLSGLSLLPELLMLEIPKKSYPFSSISTGIPLHVHI